MSTIERIVRSPVLLVAAFAVIASIILMPRINLPRTRAESRPVPIVLWSDGAALPQAQTQVQQTPPAAPLPPITARIGLQVGHWESAGMPDELAALRPETGASAGGLAEVDINYAIAQRVATILRARGITVDILPATIPPGYTADAFIAVHSDYNNSPAMNGFKLARFRDSAIPARDDALIAAITTDYGAATGQGRDSYVTRAMTGYYAFNSGAFRHTIAPQTPGVIIELGFLTNPNDRALLVERQDVVANGLASGIIRFLTSK